MNLDDLLRDTLADDRWALPVPVDTLSVVRRKRALRQRTRVVGAAVVLALTGIGGAALISPGSGPSAHLTPYAAGGLPEGSPAPGISPPFVPESGRDWLMNRSQWQAYDAMHTHPSPAPGQSSVHSPAPLSSQSENLLFEITHAGLPADSRYTRDDSSGGQPGVAVVQAQLPNGVHLYIVEYLLQEPYNYEDSQLTVAEAAKIRVTDIPGTSSALLTWAGTASAFVVSRGGVATTWAVSQGDVSPETLWAWSTAAEQHSGH